MKQSIQGGSIRKFILVAIILAGLLAGGIYFMQQTPQPEPTAEEGSIPTEEAPYEEVREEETQPIAELPGQAITEQLPETGPAEAFGVLISLGVVSLVAVYYLRSRRPELSL